MSSYRVARRSFLRGVGAGAFGLKIMLRNLEAMAQGAGPPPRFLLTHWPVGTQKYWFCPVAPGTSINPALPTLPTLASSGTNWDVSRILKPFGDAGLKNDMIVLYGLQTNSLGAFGGGHEAGTPRSTTGARTPGTRQNGGETDDAVAGGPSWDQILLKSVPALQRTGAGGAGYVNAICDARVDSLETSTQCLSYDYATRAVASAQGGFGGSVTENVPLLPTLSPLQLYNRLFSGFMPGGGGDTAQMAKLLRARKSVLDSASAQLARMKTLAPASEASKIDAHASAVRKAEMALSAQIQMGTVNPGQACMPPMAPASSLGGKTGSKNDYKSTPTLSSIDDSVVHEQVGKTHMEIIRAAFVCDLIRVASFQWSPGTNHVSFKGLFPNDTNGIYMHHPTSHLISRSEHSLSAPPPSGQLQDVAQFLANVQTWYNQKTADILAQWKATTDVYGGNLLAQTIIPYVTEVAETTHTSGTMPALIFGGSALGMKGGQYQTFESRPRTHNDLWMTIAQAYFKTTTPLDSLPAMNPDGTRNTFTRTNVAPIAGLWAMPPT